MSMEQERDLHGDHNPMIYMTCRHAIKLMKIYAAANSWLAFFNVTFQMKPHCRSEAKLRAVIDCLLTQLIKGQS